MCADKLPDATAMLGALVGVHVQPLPWEQDFIDLASRFAHLPGTVVLLSGGDLDCARFHLLGVWPWLALSSRPGRVIISADNREQTLSADPFTVLRSLLNHLRLPQGTWAEPLAAGLMGYLAYDLKDCLEALPRTGVDDLGLPQMLFYAPSVLVVHDKLERSTSVLVPLRKPAATESPEMLLQRFEAQCRSQIHPRQPFSAPADGLRANFSQAAYEEAVQRVIDYIAAGDVYQVNLSQRFQTPFHGDGFALFRHLFACNPAPFFAYIQAGDHQIISTSPERFLQRAGNRVETRPIKGTRPRGRNAQEDTALQRELAASAKDDAELSMIVDLLRNDLGKVCEAGSVQVTEHKRLEAYQNVYHLVSVVQGELEAGRDAVDLIRATFPGGSITGCPKVRAMEIIDELEPCRRHVYCGSIGYLSFHDTLDLSIAIRTATLVNDSLCFSVGGGVVFDSDPRAEYEETLHKGRTLAAACAEHVLEAEPAARVWLNGRLVALQEARLPVNDQGLQYGYGFFETIRVDRGRVPLLAEHAARFNKTWQALMPGPLPDLSWETLIDQVVSANGLQDRCAAVKILATRGTRDEAPWDHNLLVSARAYTHRLRQVEGSGLKLATYPHPRQSPLADYKTLNYLYYHQSGHWAQTQGGDEALILNPDGSVSETSTANLLLIHQETVIRPQSPAVLPGVMAQAACRFLAGQGYAVIQRPVLPNELLSADAVLAANALMGVVPVSSLDNRPCRAGNDLWRQINDALIPNWRA